MKKTMWQENELQYLTDNYNKLDIKDIILTLDRSKSAIFSKAYYLKLAKVRNNKKSNILPLLDGSLTSFYWIGYLLSDGSFVDNQRSVKLICAEADYDQIKKFSILTGAKISTYISKSGFIKNNKYHSVSCYDHIVTKQIMEKFHILPNKTYNPPNFNNYTFTDNEILSMIIGIIDGDGCISRYSESKGFRLTIQLHAAWISNLKFINFKLHNICNISIKNKIYIDKRGYANFAIGHQSILKCIKKFIIDNKLPVLNRKWDKIVV